MKDSRKSKRIEERIKFPDGQHRYCSVGCGSNEYNSQLQFAGIGVDWPPANSNTGDTSDLLERNGFERNDWLGAREMLDKIDEAIETSKEQAKNMCGEPTCCKTVTIKVECEGATHDSTDIQRFDKALDGREPKCGKTYTVKCDQ